MGTTQSAERGTCKHKKICCRLKCTKKLGLARAHCMLLGSIYINLEFHSTLSALVHPRESDVHPVHPPPHFLPCTGDLSSSAMLYLSTNIKTSKSVGCPGALS